MTFREVIIRTIESAPTDQLPFVPRLDLWYRANKMAGTLPDKYRNASLRDISDSLEVGYHCLLPDFSEFEYEDGDSDIGLGVYHLSANCYETIFHNVKKTIERKDGGFLKVTYQTPYGEVFTTSVFDERMKKSGATLWVTKEHLIKDESDFEAAAYIFENAEIIPRYDRLMQFQEYLGDRAEAVAYAHTQAGAMHLLVKDLMGFEDFCMTLTDDENSLVQLGQRIEPYMDRLFDVVSKAPSKLVFSGGNFDSTITFPPFFKRHILPQIKKRAVKAHAMNKYLICHTDGENQGLMEYLLESGMDVADSVCPAPMTRIGFDEYYRFFREKITIWGGIPSIALLQETMQEKDFYAFMDNLFSNLGDGKRLIISIADTLPPQARFERIEHIARLCKSFGPVKPVPNPGQ